MEQNSHLSFVLAEFNKLEPQIVALFEQQWNDPELSAMEYRSAERLMAFLAQHGFKIEKAACGIPTAFIATSGIGQGPTIAILAEYDALPNLANVALPKSGGNTSIAGHACGHNHIGPTNAAAAILTSKFLTAHGISGQVKVIGCPAEEILWGKIALLKNGAFEGADVILTSHGDYQNAALSRPCQSVVSGEFVFLGTAGHGGFVAATNALEAAEQFVASVEKKRLDICPEVKLRHVMRKGGVMPGITPDEARVWYTARHVEIEQAQISYAAIVETAQEIAKQFAIDYRHQFITETRGYLPNDVLGKLLYRTLNEVGPPQWSDDDIAFMNDLSAAATPTQAMKLPRHLEFLTSGEDYYGQDDGEVSWRIPLGRVNWAYPTQVPIHHWAWTALSGHKSSHAGPFMATKAIALAAIKLIVDPSSVEAASAELKSRVQGHTIKEPRLGAYETLCQNPQNFWDASWSETAVR